MLRLWLLSAQLPLIAGLYLILTGIGRFVEEAYRGEPQTPIYYGLRLYQWVAVATVIIGAIMTTVSNVSAPQNIQLSWFNVLVSFAFGLLTWFSLGVDFPKSNKRFARLV
jgi:prolipoprotein diacylglyceryltransferase